MLASLFSTWKTRLSAIADRVSPPSDDPEERRRIQLFITFSLQGFVFGCLFSGFYFAIGHPWGAAIVLVCTIAMAGAPTIVRRGGLNRAGNIYALLLVFGFTGLTAIEGGIHGHAVAWLAVVPLCACILVDQRMGRLWCGICLVIMGIFCVLDFKGIRPPVLYPSQWESTVTAAGYLSLTVFMATVGIFFERSRRRSLLKLRDALDALSDANGRLNDLDKERRAFLSIAAHDLRSPLNSIMGFAQLVLEYTTLTDEVQRDSLTRIRNSGAQMRDLLDRLLGNQAIEEGKLNLKIESCDLVALARMLVETQQISATAKDIAIVLDAPASPLWAVADHNATIQVVDNFLSNAIKFSPAGRPVIVRVRAVPAEDRVFVEVQDAGPGLSEEDQAKLYGRFMKLSARPTAGESSSGLGLSIVKRLAEAMNGELSCRSKLGDGATFSLSLKRASSEVAPIAGVVFKGDAAVL